MAVAVSAISTAAAAWGTAAFVGAAATAAMETGLALSVIGAATGSKDLMQAGSVLGIVGGGVGLAAGAGMFGEAIAAGAAESGWSIGSSAATNAAETGAVTAGDATANAVSGGMAAGSPLEAAGTGLTENGALASSTDALTGLQAAPTAVQTGEALGGNPAVLGAGGNVNPATGQVMNSAAAPALDPSAGMGMADPLGNAAGAPAATATAPASPAALPTTDPAEFAKLDFVPEKSLAEKLAGELGAKWNSLGDMSKAMILKSAMAIPGGIQAQANKAKELAMMQQKINQTSYGSQVPSFGLINKVRGA